MSSAPNTPIPGDSPEEDELIKAMMYDLERPGEISPDPTFMVDTDEYDAVDVTKIPTQPLK
ncbi:MAG TPA: hypothetical protein VGF67_27865 [Ktedonobacteraceae bacterium]|jgi:hypothetical protein